MQARQPAITPPSKRLFVGLPAMAFAIPAMV